MLTTVCYLGAFTAAGLAPSGECIGSESVSGIENSDAQ
ncbi:hypothetical protein LCGC14_0328500 [marine sediment metagenome]|uniref:Uncharacterized protein n=1 Tax=marine sediment metagenome TaxID=412755 RepID=A0A0F9TH10_9ZZZZ